MCALSVDPEQRFANCAELAEAIEAVAGDRLATHADVIAHFRAPEPAARPSVAVRPPPLPTHHSSLSALVAPLRPSDGVTRSESEPIAHGPTLPEWRVSRSVWAIAAISGLVGLVGTFAVAHYGATPGERRGAAASAPMAGTPLPSVAPAVRVSPAPLASQTPAEPAPAVLEVAPQPSEAHAKPNPPHRSGTALKPTLAKPRMPAKAARPPEKTAAKYGI
jgi:hypothetical protein